MGWSPDSEDQITFDGSNLNTAGFLSSTTRVGVIITNIDGLIDQPPIRVEDRVRPGQHGARAGALKLHARPFTIEGVVFGTSRADLESRKSALQALMLPDGFLKTLQYTHPSDGVQIVDCRVQDPFAWGDPYEMGQSAPHVAARFHVGMVAHDPRRYSAALEEAYTGAITAGSGLFFPITFPLTFDVELDGASVTVPASGTFERPATIRMYGPATNPRVEDTSGSGLRVEFEGIAVSESEVLVVDTDEQTAAVYAVSGADFHRMVVGESPVAYWRGNDTTATIDDEIGSHPGTWSGGYTLGIDGALAVDGNLAVQLNGASGTYGTVPYHANLNPSDYTVAAWVRVDAVGSAQYVYDTVDTTLFTGVRLGVDASGIPFAAVGTGAAIDTLPGTSVMTIGEWYFLAVTQSGTTRELYVNGVQEATDTATHAPNTTRVSRIGADAPSGANRLTGSVDELFVVSDAIGATRVQALYDAGTTTLAAGTNAYPYIDFDTLVWANLLASASTLYYRAQIITDPAFMEVDTRAAWV